MAGMRHPNILGFLGLCMVPPCLVSEYCTRGSLYDILRDARSSARLARHLTWARRLSMVRRCCAWGCGGLLAEKTEQLAGSWWRHINILTQLHTPVACL